MRGWFLTVLVLSVQAVSADPLYRLPWPEGRAFMFSQAPGGYITTHHTRASLHAVDIPMPEGTPVLAARGGRVIEVEWRHGADRNEDPLTHGGNYVSVRHEDGTVATYAHLEHAGVAVEPGESVGVGKLLGYSGNTGYSSGPHLHFGVARIENGHEVSIPFRFYVGSSPPIVFPPRSALLVTADYSARAEPPRSVRDATRLVAWKPKELGEDEKERAWLQLAAALASVVAGMVWFWWFSRS